MGCGASVSFSCSTQRELTSRVMLPQEDSARKQEAERRAVAEQIEAERRATEQYKASLDKEVQAARALAEAEGRIKENRANEDINRRRAAQARAVELIPDHSIMQRFVSMPHRSVE